MIYEVRDETADEMYYPIGLFLSKVTAIEAATDFCPDDSPQYHDDYCKIIIVEYLEGMHMGSYKTICTIEFEKKFDDEDCCDEGVWEEKEATGDL